MSGLPTLRSHCALRCQKVSRRLVEASCQRRDPEAVIVTLCVPDKPPKSPSKNEERLRLLRRALRELANCSDWLPTFPARSRVDAESQLRAAAVPLEDRKGTDSCFDNRLSRQVALPFRRREFAGVASDPKMPGRQYDCIGPRFQILYRISLINTLEIKNVI
jgi:hypothetical protein